MSRRWIPVALVLAAAAVAALEAFGESLEGAGSRLHAFLWAVVLALTVTGAAVRAPVLAQGTVPAVGRSAVVGCLAIFCVQAVVGLVTELRRP